MNAEPPRGSISCPQCGYTLTRLQDRCPECGFSRPTLEGRTKLDRAQLFELEPSRVWPLAIRGMIAFAILIVPTVVGVLLAWGIPEMLGLDWSAPREIVGAILVTPLPVAAMVATISVPPTVAAESKLAGVPTRKIATIALWTWWGVALGLAAHVAMGSQSLPWGAIVCTIPAIAATGLYLRFLGDLGSGLRDEGPDRVWFSWSGALLLIVIIASLLAFLDGSLAPFGVALPLIVLGCVAAHLVATAMLTFDLVHSVRDSYEYRGRLERRAKRAEKLGKIWGGGPRKDDGS